MEHYSSGEAAWFSAHTFLSPMQLASSCMIFFVCAKYNVLTVTDMHTLELGTFVYRNSIKGVE